MLKKNLRTLLTATLMSIILTVGAVASTPIIDEVVTPITISINDRFWGGFQSRENVFQTFEDPIDQVFFNQFGDNFQFLREKSTPVAVSQSSGSIHMRVLYNLAMVGDTRPSHILDRATGETIEDWDNATSDITIYTIFSIEDALSNIKFDRNIHINTALPDWESIDISTIHTGWDRPPVSIWGGSPTFVHNDEATGRAYYMMVHHGTFTGDVDISIAFAFDRILSSMSISSETIENVNVSSILEEHEATFIRRETEHSWRNWHMPPIIHVPDNEWVGGVWELPATQPMPPRLSPPAVPEYTYVTERGELEIPLHNNVYLTNLALRGNYLHVQLREEDMLTDIWRFERFSDREQVGLVDTRLIFDNMSIDAEWTEITEPQWNFATQWTANSITLSPGTVQPWHGNINQDWTLRNEFTLNNAVDLSIVDLNTSRPINNMRYTERIYRLANPSVVDYLEFQVSRSYHEVNLPVNLEVPAFYVEKFDYKAEVEGEFDIVVDGETIAINNLTIRPLQLSFDVDADIMQYIYDMDIAFINNDDTETTFNWRQMSSAGNRVFSTMMSSAIWMLPPDESDTFTITFSGAVINLDTAVAVRLNDTIIPFKR